jgi:hypothetical protein
VAAYIPHLKSLFTYQVLRSKELAQRYGDIRLPGKVNKAHVTLLMPTVESTVQGVDFLFRLEVRTGNAL